MFSTGADVVPPLGFQNKPSIVWLYGSTAKFATASTCDVQLRLPTCHGDDYAAFKEAMIMSLSVASQLAAA